MAETALAERRFVRSTTGAGPDCHQLSGPTGILTHMGNASATRSNRFTVVEPAAAAADSMRNAGPGWYFDPDDVAIYRYWDGNRWTDHRSDTVLSAIPPR